MKTTITICAVVAVGSAIALVWMYLPQHEYTNKEVERAAVSEADVPSDTLLIIAEEFVPYEYVEDGEIVGVNVEVAEVIFNRLGIPYEIRIIPWARTWKMLQEGIADATFSTSYEEFRDEHLYFTPTQQAFKQTGEIPEDHQWLNEFVFFIRDIHSDSLVFESYEQVKRDGYKIAVIKGNSYVDSFMNADLDTYEYASARDSFNALLEGEVDVYIVDRVIGLSTIEQMGIGDEITYIPDVVDAKPMLMPFSKKTDFPNAESVMVQYYEELAKMRANGEYDEIYSKYITE